MSNTLNLGAGIWGTKEDSLLAYNNENGNYKPLPFDFTRASSATVVNKAGLIETVQSGIPRIDFLGNTNGALLLEPQRTNLITQSEAFGNAYWTKSGATIQGDASTAGAEQVVNGDFAGGSTGWSLGGTTIISSGQMTITADGTYNNSAVNTLSSVAVVGKTYLVSFDVVNNSLVGNKIMQFGSVTSSSIFKNNSAQIVVGSSGTTQTLYVTNNGTTNTSLDPRLTSGSTSGSLVIDNVSVKEVQGFTSPSADSPLNAFKLVEGTNTGTHELSRPISFTSGQYYSYSVFVKKGERTQFLLSGGNTSTFVAESLFDVENGTIISTSLGTSSIELISNGFYRCTISGVAGATASTAPRVYLSEGAGIISYTGDGTSGLYIYGAQVEQSSYPTSYIPTQGSTVTRNLETCTGAGNDQVINSTEGVLYAEISALANDLSTRKISISDGTSSNAIYIGYITTTNKIRGYINVANGGGQVVDFTLSDITAFSKFAVRWLSNGNATFWVNGSNVGSMTAGSGFSSSTLSQLQFTREQGGTAESFYGNTKDLRVYNTALTDGELATLTTL